MYQLYKGEISRSSIKRTTAVIVLRNFVRLPLASLGDFAKKVGELSLERLRVTRREKRQKYKKLGFKLFFFTFIPNSLFSLLRISSKYAVAIWNKGKKKLR